MTSQGPPVPSDRDAAPPVEAQISFRPLGRDDFERLAGWLAESHVSRWWGPTRPVDQLEAEYGPGIDGTDPTEVFVVEVNGTSVGMIQRYMNRDDPGWEATDRHP